MTSSGNGVIAALSTTTRRRARASDIPRSDGMETLNIYTHVVDASHRSAVELVEERLLTELDPNGPKIAIVPKTGTPASMQSLDLGLEAPPGFEPGMEVLQTSALPLGDGAGRNWGSKLTWNVRPRLLTRSTATSGGAEGRKHYRSNVVSSTLTGSPPPRLTPLRRATFAWLANRSSRIRWQA